MLKWNTHTLEVMGVAVKTEEPFFFVLNEHLKPTETTHLHG
jgi:hypothetical protein